MRYIVVSIIIACCLISVASAEEFFPIGAYSSMRRANLDSLSQVKDCNFNTYRFGWDTGYDLHTTLQKAEEYDVQAVPINHIIQGYSGAQWKDYQAEQCR